MNKDLSTYIHIASHKAVYIHCSRFLGGLIVANLGIVGIYLGKIFDETKKRPLYVISKRINI